MQPFAQGLRFGEGIPRSASQDAESAQNVFVFPAQLRQEQAAASVGATWDALLRSAEVKNQNAGSAMSDISREEIAARLGEASARSDEKLARLEGRFETIAATIIGKLDATNEKLSADHEYNRSTRWVIVGLALALAALIIAMATYGDAMFGRGMNVRDVVDATVKELQEQAKKAETPAVVQLPGKK